ncbi:MAG: hypothetical protein KDC39_10940 [Actinobacteria bacterium]|nr:hypothetical protein [Actinomycetota bacterium]
MSLKVESPQVTPSLPAPVRGQRRPLLIGLGIALVGLGALLAAWLATSLGATQPVLALVNTVHRGSLITSQDLTIVNLNPDPQLAEVPGSELGSVVGQRALVDLPAGSILPNDTYSDVPLPASGDSLVGLALSPSRMPLQPLTAGTPVRVVLTPRDGDEPTRGAPSSTLATVVSTSYDADTAQTVVEVSLPAQEAPALAAAAATGRIAIVVDSEVDR